MIFLFCFWENVFFACFVACYLFMLETFKLTSKEKPSEAAIHRCSSKYVFLKIWQYSQKNTCVGVYFRWSCRPEGLHFYWRKDSNTGFFLWILRNYWEQFFYRTPSVHYTFQNFNVIMEFFGCLWVQNWYFSYFLSHCFVFFHNSIVRIGIPWLFYTCICTKVFSKYNFHMH